MSERPEDLGRKAPQVVESRGVLAAGEPAALWPENEITLLDLLLVLVRRRLIVAAVAVLCTVAGLLYALLTPPVYQYRSVVSIGGEGKPFESLGTVQAKVAQLYVPEERDEYGRDQPESPRPKVSVIVPKKSQLVVLNSEGVAEAADTHLALHGKVLARLVADHAELAGARKADIQAQIANALSDFEKSASDGEAIRVNLAGLEDAKIAVKERVREVEAWIERTEADMMESLRGDEADAASLDFLLISSEIQRSRLRLSDLEQGLLIDLPHEQRGLEMQLSEVENKKAAALEKSRALEALLASIKDTKVLGEPRRSFEPAGIDRKIIAALSLAGGLFLGVFAAFAVELVARIRRQGRTAA